MGGSIADLKSIFAKVLEIRSPEGRGAYLEQACGGDARLRAEVEALLQAQQAAGSFFDNLRLSPALTTDESMGERPGAVVGRYKLVEAIGEGGMGSVWMARQTEPVKRLVAVKLIKAGMDSRQVLARFEAERQALALMDHPNIAKVLDGGATPEGRPYFVMELVKGVPITAFCDERKLTPRQRLELFVPVCQAIQHAHTKGIIHRDVKPSNVLVALDDDRPVVKVIDFGVAKAAGQPLTEQTLVTGFGAIVGTLEYMAPEQAEVNQLDIDTRSDVYALGVLLYELLTGTTPFTKKGLEKAGMLEMLRVIREQEPTKPSTKLSTAEGLPTLAANRGTEPAKLTKLVRGELDWIVMKALEKDRNRRYQTANGLAMDVQRYLADEPVLACPPSAAYRFRKFARRNKRALTVAVLAGVLAGVLAVGIPLNLALRGQRDTALANQDRAERAERENKIRAHLAKATAYRRSGGPGQRFQCLAEITQALKLDPSPELRAELRTEAMAALVLPDMEVAHEWEGGPEDSVGVSFDAAFQRYVRLDNQGGLTVCRQSAGREEVITRLPAHGNPRFGGPWMSPDGRLVAYGHNLERVHAFGAVRLWKLDPTPEVLLDEPAGMHESALAFHPKGRQLAIGHADKSVSVYDLATGRRVQRLAVGAAPDLLAFHPRESRLAVAAGNAVQLFDTDTGRELPALRHPAAVTRTYSVAWHPDGRRLATGCNDGKIHVWDTETAAEAMPPWDSGDDGIGVAFSPAGDRLVSAGWHNPTWLWDAAAGRPVLKLPSYVGWQFSPDGRRLGHVVSGNRIRQWRLADGRELTVLRGRDAAGRGGFHSPVVHADGRTLAASSHGRLHFFDLATGEELASVRLPHPEKDFPVFFDAPRPPPGRAGGETDEGPGGWVTSGWTGLLLWPARPDAARPEVLCVGPPQQLAPGLASWVAEGASTSADGRVVAVPQGNSTIVLHRGRPDRRVVLGPQFDVRFTAVSPDGRWVVTGNHWQDGRSRSVRIWDADSGQSVNELPLEGSTSAKFSPDGRWLMTHTSGASTRLWEVGTWRELRRFDPARFAFSPDSRLLALGDVFGVVRLVETATGREVARLTGPELAWYSPACFTPDGMRLVASSSGPLYVWDLRLIRQQLKGLGLDWDWPEFPPADRAGPAPRPVRVEVLAGDLAPAPEEKAREAIGRYRPLVEANPDDASACNNLAWAYLTAPEALRDVEAALPLAEKAVRREPGSAVYRNTLGVTYYRAGRYREAVETLRPNLQGQEDWGLAFDLYFLAMSHHRLGEAARARDYYDWAVRWTQAQRSLPEGHLEELKMFRAEAAELLKVDEK